ncbi:MAG: glutathione S-transferase family protein, partial [Pseudomonadota bacterium]
MLILYHGLTSVCSVKVRIGLAEIGLEYESHVLDLPKGDQHHPDYLKINPDAVVPTLVDDGLVLYESSLILEYLDREYNDGNLMPAGKAAEAGARLWLLRCLSVHDAVNSLSFSTAHRDRTLASKTAEEIAAMLANMPDPVKRMKRKDLLDNGLASVFVQQALLN